MQIELNAHSRGRSSGDHAHLVTPVEGEAIAAAHRVLRRHVEVLGAGLAVDLTLLNHHFSNHACFDMYRCN